MVPSGALEVRGSPSVRPRASWVRDANGGGGCAWRGERGEGHRVPSPAVDAWRGGVPRRAK